LQSVQVLKAHSPKRASKNVHTTHGCQKKPFCPDRSFCILIKTEKFSFSEMVRR